MFKTNILKLIKVYILEIHSFNKDESRKLGLQFLKILKSDPSQQMKKNLEIVKKEISNASIQAKIFKIDLEVLLIKRSICAQVQGYIRIFIWIPSK